MRGSGGCCRCRGHFCCYLWSHALTYYDTKPPSFGHALCQADFTAILISNTHSFSMAHKLETFHDAQSGTDCLSICVALSSADPFSFLYEAQFLPYC